MKSRVWFLVLSCQVLGCELGYIDISSQVGVDLRIENAAPDTAKVSITEESAPAAEVLVLETTTTEIQVPSERVTNGEVDCAERLRVFVTFDGSPVELQGDGTGTPGFDSGSSGLSGERFLIRGQHYGCDDTIIVRLMTSQSGELEVVLGDASLPDPITGDSSSEPSADEMANDSGDDVVSEPEAEEDPEVTIQVVNDTESTIQLNFAAGDGTVSDSGSSGIADEFDVRVPPFTTTTGPGDCTAEYIIAAAHLEATGTTFEEGNGDIFANGGNVVFHGVVLSGDGTGTAGFDSNSIAVERGRLLQSGQHYECGDLILVTVDSTNNQLERDEDGIVVLDEFGNPKIKYNVGKGRIQVVSP